MDCTDKSEVYRQVGFRPGDIVRSRRDGRYFGVVVMVDQYWDDPPRYQLYVDAPDHLGVWPLEATVLADDDPELVAEAKRLGLRGLPNESSEPFNCEPAPQEEVDWRKRFKPGDVVRSTNGVHFGVVVAITCHRDESRPPMWVLHVDMPDWGVSKWPPEDAVLANDPESVTEARRLGLGPQAGCA